MFSKIMIPTDGSILGDIAATEGIKMAAKLGAEVVIIHIVREYDKAGVSKSMSKAEYEEAAKVTGRKILQPLEELAQKMKVKYKTILGMANHIALAVVREAKECGCDLIFIGSNGCGGWDHLLVGSVSNKVLASAEIPVLVYRLREDQVPADAPEYHSSSVFVFPPA
ncbi:MAG: universal stress protein [Alistipes senegalensis]|nr:universal stress protein [Oxalobacter formigenes]MCM1280710.1 universal stress protein [Alistipes senegalensis]